MAVTRTRLLPDDPDDIPPAKASLSEIKKFLLWCKREQILQVKVAGVEVTFSPQAMLRDEGEREESIRDLLKQVEAKTNETEAIAEAIKDGKPDPNLNEDDILYWST